MIYVGRAGDQQQQQGGAAALKLHSQSQSQSQLPLLSCLSFWRHTSQTQAQAQAEPSSSSSSGQVQMTYKNLIFNNTNQFKNHQRAGHKNSFGAVGLFLGYDARAPGTHAGASARQSLISFHFISFRCYSLFGITAQR